MRIDQADPATYGAHAARQFLDTAEADPRFREGMTKRPSSASISIAFVDGAGEQRKIGVREIFCRMDGDALVLVQFMDAEGETVRDLPVAVPPPVETGAELDDADRLHELILAELGDAEASPSPDEMGPAPEPAPPEPARERRRPTGPLRQYGEAPEPAQAARTLGTPPPSEPSPRGPAVMPPAAKGMKEAAGAPTGLTVRALDEGEAASLRTLIEARAGQARWASELLRQAAERHPGDRKPQNEHLANLVRISLDPSRAESRTPLAAALRGVIEDVGAYKPGMLDRDPLKAEKLSLQPFARASLAPTGTGEAPLKTVSGTARRTPAQVLARLEDPKLARATRVKFLLEIVPEMIETWRPDKESSRSEAGNENSPAVVRRLFAVANEQRQQRKFIDDGSAFKKANERYTALADKLPKRSAADDS